MDITYKLPHPIRNTCNEVYENNAKSLDRVFDTAFEDLDLEKCSFDFLVTVLNTKIDTTGAPSREGMTDHERGILDSSCIAPYKYRKQKSTIFTTSNDIDALLQDTEIGDDIPLAYLRPPFKSCYFEFTEDRSSSLQVYNEESGDHILEGVYIFETEIIPNTFEMKVLQGKADVDPSKPLRILDLMFTGSPLGKKNCQDDALRIQGFYIQDESVTINDELNIIQEKYGNDSDFVNDIDYLRPVLNHMAKTLLFINCKQYRDTAFNEKEELEKKVNSFKSPKKINKYLNKIRKSYNRIVIKPEDNIVYKKGKEVEVTSTKNPLKSHWRKGHFRMQPYGPGSTKRKVIFVEPTVVGGLYAGKKKYSATTKFPVVEHTTED